MILGWFCVDLDYLGRLYSHLNWNSKEWYSVLLGKCSAWLVGTSCLRSQWQIPSSQEWKEGMLPCILLQEIWTKCVCIDAHSLPSTKGDFPGSSPHSPVFAPVVCGTNHHISVSKFVFIFQLLVQDVSSSRLLLLCSVTQHFSSWTDKHFTIACKLRHQAVKVPLEVFALHAVPHCT